MGDKVEVISMRVKMEMRRVVGMKDMEEYVYRGKRKEE